MDTRNDNDNALHRCVVCFVLAKSCNSETRGLLNWILNSKMTSLMTKTKPVKGVIDVVQIALLQANPVVGDIKGNSEIITEMAKSIRKWGKFRCNHRTCNKRLSTRDLLLQADFVRNVMMLQHNANRNPRFSRDPGFSFIAEVATRYGVVRAGDSVRVVTRKQLLPTYDVFDEARHFEAMKDLELLGQ